jgi:hypothetical protein
MHRISQIQILAIQQRSFKTPHVEHCQIGPTAGFVHALLLARQTTTSLMVDARNALQIPGHSAAAKHSRIAYAERLISCFPQ